MSKLKTGQFFCGTSNITLQGNKTTFPPEMRDKSRLEYYATIFNSLEVNASFYKIPQKRTFKRWAAETPEDFCFSVKLWKGITHVKGLEYRSEDISSFLDAVSGTGKKLGCILLQLPKSTGIASVKKLEELLDHITEAQSEPPIRIALELRNPDWYVSGSKNLFSNPNISLVQHDMPGSSPDSLPGNPPFVFLRFHGPDGDYRGAYQETFLREKAQAVKKWISAGKDVYAYFNNTIGDAYTDAIQLARLVNSNER